MAFRNVSQTQSFSDCAKMYILVTLTLFRLGDGHAVQILVGYSHGDDLQTGCWDQEQDAHHQPAWELKGSKGKFERLLKLHLLLRFLLLTNSAILSK